MKYSTEHVTREDNCCITVCLSGVSSIVLTLECEARVPLLAITMTLSFNILHIFTEKTDITKDVFK